MYLYEQLQARGLNPITLPLDLAYSIEYNALMDYLGGDIDITYKAVEINLN